MEEIELHDTVTLASGETIPCDYLSVIPNGYMFISAKTSNPSSLMALVTDEAKTSRIEYGDHVFIGYTEFVQISKESDTIYKVALRQPFEA